MKCPNGFGIVCCRRSSSFVVQFSKNHFWVPNLCNNSLLSGVSKSKGGKLSCLGWLGSSNTGRGVRLKCVQLIWSDICQLSDIDFLPVTVFSASPALVVRGRSSATSSLFFTKGISTYKLTGRLDLKALAIDALSVHSIDGIPCPMIIIIFLKRLAIY
jgi:hypothetical protein